MWNLTKTIDQALEILDLDDGRPLFLVVHTYRVHGPFRDGPDENQDAFDAFIEKCRRGGGVKLHDLANEERRAEILPFLERLAYDHAGRFTAEKFIQWTVVDGDLAFTAADVNPCLG